MTEDSAGEKLAVIGLIAITVIACGMLGLILFWLAPCVIAQTTFGLECWQGPVYLLMILMAAGIVATFIYKWTK